MRSILSFALSGTALASITLVAVLLTACIPTDDSPAPSGSSGDNGTLTADSTASNVGWTSHAVAYRGQNNLRVAYVCPESGTAGIVWGNDIYTDDSSVCTAAVHAGIITFAAGGRVVIEIRPGRSSYEGTTRNGVTTNLYGTWFGSYIFP